MSGRGEAPHPGLGPLRGPSPQGEGEASKREGAESAAPRPAPNVTEHLLARGLLTPAALARAQAVAAETRERLDLVLTRLGLVGEADLVAAYAETLALQVATLADAPPEALLAADLPERFLRHARLLPIADTEDGVTLAMAHPDDALSLHAVRLKLRRPASSRTPGRAAARARRRQRRSKAAHHIRARC